MSSQPVSPMSSFPPLDPLVIRVLSLLPPPSLIFPNQASEAHAKLKDTLAVVGIVDGHNGGRNEEPRGVRGWFAKNGFANGVDDFAGDPEAGETGNASPKDTTAQKEYFNSLVATLPPISPFGTLAVAGSGLLLSGMCIFTPKSTPLTLSLSLSADEATIETPVSRESLSAAMWTIISVWQRVTFPLWEGRLVTDDLSEDAFELEKQAESEEVLVGRVHGFTCIPIGGDIVLAAPASPNAQPTTQVAYLDLQVTIWSYHPGSEAETRTLLSTTARVVLDRNKRPQRFGIQNLEGEKKVDVVKGTIGTKDDKGGVYEDIELDDEEDLFEDDFVEPDEKKSGGSEKGKL